MSKKYITAILLLLGMAIPFAASADRFYIMPGDLTPGKTETLQMVLDNSQEYFGFQAEMKFPEGLQAAKGSDGEADITLSSRAEGGDYHVNSNVLPDGTLVFGAFTANLTPFRGTTGVLVNLNVSVAGDYAGGSVELTNIKFIDGQDKDVELASTSATFGVLATGITLDNTELSLREGETATLTATVAPAAATDKSVTWTSSDETVATVDTEGNVKALKVGSASITAATNNGHTATCAVTVGAVLPESVTLDRTEWIGKVGAEVKLSATVAPANTTDKTVTWKSSNAAVTTVDANGNVKAIALGEATITATCGEVSATCKVTVVPTPAESVTLSATTAELKVGGTVSLTATVLPADATDKTVTWTSSNAPVATVDANGNVKAIVLGEASITATCGAVSATCKVTVVPTPVESITLSNSSLALTEGETATLTATVAPADATDKTVSWTSSDASVATVDTNGKVTALKPGKATVTATSANGKTASCEVTVAANIISVTGITISKSELSLIEGESATLTAAVLPENATDKSITWTSSDASVATVDANGKVTAVKVGTATITVASSNGKSASCIVTVLPVVATSVTLDKTEWSGKVGESVKLTATVAPANTTDKTVTWKSSNEAVATVDANGNVKAIALGEATITATCGTVSATCKVTVVPTPVESVTLSNTSLALTEGETATLTATVAPADATDKTVTWTSSDAAVATVDASGKVTAVKPGKATITATSANGKTASCEVTVAANIISVTGITISKSELSLIEGQSETLTAAVLPENATDKTVTWTSSDASVATVDNNGKVTAVKVGTATITVASSNGKTASCAVTVLPVVATSVTLDKNEWSGKVGESVKLTATIAPDNTTDKTVTWSSSNAAVATVDANGNVKAIALGEATITATCGAVSATCKVTVVPTLVETLTIDPTTWSGEEGSEFKITANVLPEDADDKTLTWSSSDETVATVDGEGNVKVLKEGNCVITVATTDGSNLTAECVITSVAGVEGIFGEDTLVDVYDMNGVLVKKGCERGELKNQLTPGVYVLRSGNATVKAVIR